MSDSMMQGDTADGEESSSIATELKSALGAIQGDEWHFAVSGSQQDNRTLTLQLMMTPTIDR